WRAGLRQKAASDSEKIAAPTFDSVRDLQAPGCCAKDNASRAEAFAMGIHQNFVGGRWIEASAAAPNVNPSNTGDIVGEYARGTRADANKAIEAAKAAFPAWSRSSPQVRYDALKKVSDEILSRKDELGRLLAREEGKTLAEGVGEVLRAGQIFAFFSG